MTLPPNSAARSQKPPVWLRIAFWLSIAISVAVVMRRLVALTAPSSNGPPQMVQLDNAFASHTALTLAHIIPALLFVLIAPFIVFQKTGRLAVIERFFYILGGIVGLTAYSMSAFSVGGWTERSAVLIFDSFFLFSLSRAYIYRLEGDSMRERRWQLRAVAILLGIATTRPVMGVFFATSRLTHLVPQQFFGIAFWIGFSINVIAFELWIRSIDRRGSRETPGLFRDSQARSA